jgi:cell division protein ZapA
MSDSPSERIVPVFIHGQRYPVRSSLSPTYVAELASYVDEKMRVASEANQTNDSLRVAVLAALNLADEIFRYRQDRVESAGEIASRTGELERLLDSLLEENAPRLR